MPVSIATLRARRFVADLEAQGLLAGIKDHTNNVGHCDRCKTTVEPRLSTQWFIKIQSLAEKAIAAVKPDEQGNKAIRIVPDQYEKVYLEWMENIHDLVHLAAALVGPSHPRMALLRLSQDHRRPHRSTVCAHCGSEKITQETDVLDTWFSSGLLPVFRLRMA